MTSAPPLTPAADLRDEAEVALPVATTPAAPLRSARSPRPGLLVAGASLVLVIASALLLLGRTSSAVAVSATGILALQLPLLGPSALRARTARGTQGPAPARVRSAERWQALQLEHSTWPPTPPVVAVVALLAGAGVIHLVMAAPHLDEWWLEGAAFVAVGWLQLGLAALLVRSPSRRLLLAVVATNVVLLALWIFSRTIGLPFNPHGTVAEEPGAIDATAAGFEVLAVGLAIWLVRNPALVFRRVAGQGRLIVAVVVGVLVLTSGLITTGGVLDHAHGCAGADEEHGHGSGAAAASPEDDLGFSQLHNGQHGEAASDECGDPAVLESQLDVTRTVFDRFQTAQDARDAGYVKASPYVPAFGTHYVDQSDAHADDDGELSSEELANPTALIFNGSSPDARIVGLMYLSISDERPEGFEGSSDLWHYHESLCVRDVGNGVELPYGVDNESTPQQCASVDGDLLPESPWMLHVWTAPGYPPPPDGVFADANPDLRCGDGSYFVLPVEEWAENQDDVCRTPVR